MIYVLVDQNTYIRRRGGTQVLKDRASNIERVVASTVLAGIYSGVNTALMMFLLRRRREQQRAEAPGTKV
jgi:hypothetical protein